MSRLPRAFTIAQAREEGVDARRLRSDRTWSRPYRGMRADADASWFDVISARVRAVGPDAVVFGPSALSVWGVERPGLAAPDPDLHVAVPRPGRAPRGAGIVGYSIGLEPIHVTNWRGVPVTTRPRTWIDLARWLAVPQLVAVADQFCRLDENWCTLSELSTALRAAPRVRGAARLREALELVVPGAESYPESLLRVMLEQAGLPRAAVNASIRGSGGFVARVDLLFEDYGVIVEYEGAHHAEDKRQWRRDLTRIGELQRLGYIVERAHAGDLRDPSGLIERVRIHLLRRGWKPAASR
ncbi:hypothetical protein [Microbacterium sp.]|uniref:hypothetical protein n=1 Tax=Microbacterium sp. TaxID=51671 RepID=UPI0039E25AA6